MSPSVVGILRFLHSVFVVDFRHVSENVSAEEILVPVYKHSADSVCVITVFYVLYFVCQKRPVYIRHFFRQDSVSVSRYFFAVYVGRYGSAPDYIILNLHYTGEQSVAVVTQIRIFRVRFGILDRSFSLPGQRAALVLCRVARAVIVKRVCSVAAPACKLVFPIRIAVSVVPT